MGSVLFFVSLLRIAHDKWYETRPCSLAYLRSWDNAELDDEQKDGRSAPALVWKRKAEERDNVDDFDAQLDDTKEDDISALSSDPNLFWKRRVALVYVKPKDTKRKRAETDPGLYWKDNERSIKNTLNDKRSYGKYKDAGRIRIHVVKPNDSLNKKFRELERVIDLDN